MNGTQGSWDQVKQEKPSFGRPHVVILGAGASLAAFPDGDRHGLVLPLMSNLCEVLELSDAIEASGLSCRDRNFEDVYLNLTLDSDLAGLRELVEDRVSEYFSSLLLPDSPTIYDYLVLSLRAKDYIATFNWDPFLYLAMWRNHKVAPLPSTIYLHGCAILGHCLEHRTMGLTGAKCQTCDRPFVQSRLLYPVADKDYISDEFISAQWSTLRSVLKTAYIVTVFGYGAPASDAAAIDLLSAAWGSPGERNLEEIEIIDIRPDEELESAWSRFIHTHHYRTTDDYFSSLLGGFPRRTCEAMWLQLMEARFLEYQPVPRFESIDELHEWAAEIASYENQKGA